MVGFKVIVNKNGSKAENVSGYNGFFTQTHYHQNNRFHSMATNAKIETGDPALAIALCWFAVFYSAFMVGYWLWVEYFGIQRNDLLRSKDMSFLSVVLTQYGHRLR